MNPAPPRKEAEGDPPGGIPLAAIEAAIRSVRYGVVQVIVQDGRVIQIEKTEKIRFENQRTRGR